MRLLLDTHAFLWWIFGDASLSRAASAALSSAENDIFVSAASAWEIATKHRIGKLKIATNIVADMERAIVDQGFRGLPITVRHGQISGALKGEHKDLFDRMLIAQAIDGAMSLVSNERAFDQFGVTRL